MAEVSGTATSYDISNYVAPRLFLSGDAPRSFLEIVGATSDISGEGAEFRPARVVRSNQFTLSVEYDLDAPAQPSILDGADATYDEHSTSATHNVVQIFQEGVSLSYSSQSTQEQIAELGTSGVANIPGGGQGNQQFANSLQWQLRRKVQQIKRDLNYTMLRGTYALGATAAARQSRGLRAALSTNVFDNAAVLRDLTKAVFEEALKDMIANGAFDVGGRIMALCGADQFENLVDLYATGADAPRDRTEAGTMIRTVWTKWGPVDVMYETDMAGGEIVLTQPEFLQAVFRMINSRGRDLGVIVFEELAKTGSADNAQIYLEAGLDYGAEWRHGVVTDLNA